MEMSTKIPILLFILKNIVISSTIKKNKKNPKTTAFRSLVKFVLHSFLISSLHAERKSEEGRKRLLHYHYMENVLEPECVITDDHKAASERGREVGVRVGWERGREG